MSDRKRRVLLFIDVMSSGGAERQMSYLAMGLKRIACDVRLVVFYDQEVFYGRELKNEGIAVEVRAEGRSRLRRPLVMARLVREWQPDMVVAYKDGTCMSACLARLVTRFNLVVSERNTTQKVSFKERVKFSLYGLANRVVANSMSQGRFLEEHYPKLVSKLSVITNMIDTDKFCPAGADTVKLSCNPPVVITTARIAPQKNVLAFLHALRLLRDRGVKAQFLWYGSHADNEEYYGRVIALQRELGLDDGYITFCGSTKEIDEAYRNADFFCLPSAYEGFANVLCEAMSSGLVCCASNVCDNPFILRREERLFNPNDVLDMAAKIQAMLTIDSDCYLPEADENRRRIVDLCAEKSFIDKYLNLI